MRQRIATSSSGTSACADRLDDRRRLGGGRRECRHDRLRPGRARVGRSTFSAPASLGDEAIRKREHLRRRAVVLLEPDDRRVGKARRDAEQVLGPGAGEGVDRLVVVADDAEIVAVAEPVLEQGLLQKIDVLILVDGERAVLRAEGRRRACVVSRTGAPPARAGPRSREARRPACVARTRRRPAPSGRSGSAAPDRPAASR